MSLKHIEHGLIHLGHLKHVCIVGRSNFMAALALPTKSGLVPDIKATARLPQPCLASCCSSFQGLPQVHLWHLQKRNKQEPMCCRPAQVFHDEFGALMMRQPLLGVGFTTYAPLALLPYMVRSRAQSKNTYLMLWYMHCWAADHSMATSNSS